MNVEERIDSLRSRHAKLDHDLDAENQRPHPDDIKIHELKREKLRIKDEIAAIQG